MTVERLRKIIAYADKNREEIYSKVKRFCSFAGIDNDSDLLNILQIVRSSFEKKDYLVFQMPFDDEEIGAMCYKGDGLGYVVVNTSLPKVNVNFALSHEAYHVFFGERKLGSKVELADSHYYEHEEECAANLFAGMLLMPEVSFQRMYSKFRDESNGNEFDAIIRLMSYYQVPYMAVLVRCIELNLINGNSIKDELLNAESSVVRQKLSDLWLDDSLMVASFRDDFDHIEKIVKKTGQEYIEEEYINERTLNMVINNMRELYKKIKRK